MAEAQRIDKDNVEDIYALTPVQSGMLFHYLSEPDSSHYHEELRLQMSGIVDPGRFEAAWEYVVKRNEALRTVFRWEKIERPVQIVLKKPVYPVTVHVSGDERFAWPRRIDIAAAPFQAGLRRLSEDCFEMTLRYHHIVMDGWSMGTVLKEWLETYRALAGGEVPAAEPKTKFKLFVKALIDRNRADESRFWTTYLNGFEERTPLPVHRREAQAHGTGHSHYSYSLASSVQAQADAFVKRESITLAALLYTAWGVCLQQYSRSGDVVFGTTVSGRSIPGGGFQQTVGLFINTSPLRVRMEPNLTGIELIQQVASSLYQRLDYEHSALLDIKSYCGLDGKGDLFDSIFVLENYPLDPQLLQPHDDLYVSAYEMTETTHYDVTVSVTDAGALTFHFSYRDSLFPEEMIRAMASHLGRIVETLIGNPALPVAEIDLLSAAEKELLLGWGRKPRKDSADASLIAQFEAQASATPDRIALRFEQSSLTYAELNRKANQFAHYLRGQDVDADRVVGVMVERSLDMVIGMLAVLKAGGVYLPIDPDYPQERIDYLLQHSQASLLLTGTRSKQIAVPPSVQNVAYSDISHLGGLPEHNLDVPRDPEQLFYVLYTSGSTGNPKGVMVKSGSFANLVRWYTREFGIGADDRVLLIAPSGFDLAQKNIFAPLTSGGALCLYSPGIFDYNRMSDVISEQQITIVNCAPSAFYPLVDFNEASGFVRLGSVRHVFLGGEPINGQKLKPWLASAAYAAEIVNTYGPTECTDVVSFYRCSREQLFGEASMPIGAPVPGADLYVLGADAQLLPAGVIGELGIGGPALARGYYRAPELTAERFITTPHLPSPIVYKTGDLVRWLPSGQLEYIGRADQQVKIRGYRVELAELENALARLDGITECVVKVWSGEVGQQTVCAYYVADRDIPGSECASHLQRELPQFMIPDAFVALERFPLTPNGKIDRRALPKPDRPQQTEAGSAPAGEREQLLLDIWKKVLGEGKVFGINDSFFDAGGNSLLLIQLHVLLEKQFPGVWSISDLFSFPTIAKMAAYMEAASRSLEPGPGPGAQQQQAQEPSTASGEKPEGTDGRDIAVIGIGLQMPGAASPDAFWDTIRHKRDGIRDIPDIRAYDALAMLDHFGLNRPKGGFGRIAYLDEVDKFDYGFFQVSPKEAALMDPSQRLFTQVAYAAIEDAGYGGERLIGSRTGMYVGYGAEADYKRLISIVEPDALPMAVAGNAKPIIASRLAYLMDWRGPNLLVDTTCSSSLVAIHLACQALRAGECDQALAGGAQIHLLPVRQTEIGIESSDGRTKTFDHRSDGTGTGEGIAAVLLKPLDKALEDRDHIYAVIKGTAVNHDGASNGITAPNALAQEEVLTQAWRDAGVAPESISYIEAHGTGTKLGDPIEINGINRAFRRFTDRQQFCAVSSVKSNLGHLDHAAGIAGFIKAALALHHREIPATLHFRSPNRSIPFTETAAYVSDRMQPWEAGETPRRCGVSSFGISGTNAHIVLEEAPERLPANPIAQPAAAPKDSSPRVSGEADAGTAGHAHARPDDQDELELLVLSARTEAALQELTARYAEALRGSVPGSLRDISYTAATGRAHHDYRLAVSARSADELRAKLAVFVEGNGASQAQPGVWAGRRQGATGAPSGGEAGKPDEDWKASGAGLSREQRISRLAEQYVRGAVLDWSAWFDGKAGRKVSLPTYPFARERCFIESSGQPARHRTTQPDAQALGQALQLPLVDRRLAASIGVDIYATDFSGARHWVLDEHRLRGECLLVGTAYVEMVREALESRGEAGRLRFTDVQFLQPLQLRDGESRETHLVLNEDDAGVSFTAASRNPDSSGRDVWTKHAQGRVEPLTLRSASPDPVPVEALKETYRSGRIVPDLDAYNEATVFTFGPRWNNIAEMYVGRTELLSFLEIPSEYSMENEQLGLHPALLDNALTTIPLIQQNIPEGINEGGYVYLPFGYGALTVYGPLPTRIYSHVRLNGEITEQSQLVSFDIRIADETGAVLAEVGEYTLKKVRAAAADTYDGRFHQMEWIESAPTSADQTDKLAVTAPWVVFADTSPYAETFARLLRQHGHSVVVVEPGIAYRQLGEERYTAAAEPAALEELLDTLGEQSAARLVLLNGFGPAAETANGVSAWDADASWGVYGLLYLVQAMLRQGWSRPLDIAVVNGPAYAVTGREPALYPQHASLHGLGQVIAQEYGHIGLRSLDADESLTPERLLEELRGRADSELVAFREGKRYVRQLAIADLGSRAERNLPLHSDGVYVITGGAGGIGLALAYYLAAKQRINLALIQRSGVPPEAQWDDILREEAPDSKRYRQIAALQRLTALGAYVECHSADIGSREDTQALLDLLRARFGAVRGIIHSAGLAGDGFIFNKSKETFRNVLAPKTAGTWHLHQLTAEDPLDFFILCSSNNTLAGMAGQGDYTAANAYLDAFAAYRAKLGLPALTINWPAWRETGMAADRGVNTDQLMKTVSTQEALELFDTLVHKKVTQIHVGQFHDGRSRQGQSVLDMKLALAPALRTKLERMYRTQAVPAAPAAGADRSQVVLEGKPVHEYTIREKQLAELWQDVLGFSTLNVFDGFFDLGGDSISATLLATKIQKQLQVTVPLKVIFDQTTIHALAHYIDEQSGETREELTRIAEQPYYPLSATQQRMYMLHASNRDDVSYNLPRVLRVEGTLDPDRLDRAFQALVQRHDTLRTSFHTVGGEHVQQVQAHVTLQVEYTAIEEQELTEHALRFIRPFDLSEAPLIRVGVASLGDSEHVLLFDVHHIIADGTSLTLIMKEFAALYQEQPLPELAIQYKDYAAWHNRYVRSEAILRQERYWHGQFAGGDLPVLKLPTDFERPAQGSIEGAQWAFRVERELIASLREMAAARGLTLFMALLGAYTLLLGKISGQEDLIVGIPIAGRTQAETQPLIGMFVNSLAIRGLPSGEKTVARFLQETKQRALDAYEHQDYPFDRLVETLDLKWESGRNPLFDTMFLMQNMESPSFTLDQLTFTPLDLSMKHVHFDIEAEAIEDSDGLLVKLHYAVQSYKPETMTRFSEDYIYVLRQIVENDQCLIRDLKLTGRIDKMQDVLADALDFSF